MAKKIIDDRKILKKNVIMLSVRQYEFPDDDDLCMISHGTYNFFSNCRLNSKRWIISSLFHRKKRCLIQLQRADETIGHLLNNDLFALYACHNNSFNVEILLSMQQCHELNFIEEGLVAYSTTLLNDKIKQTPIRAFELFLKRYLTKGRYGYPFKAKFFDIQHPKFRSIYCCCDKSFPGYPNKVILGIPFSKIDSVPDDLTAVLVFDESVSFNQQLQSNEIALQHFIKNHPDNIFYYKFHPSQTEDKKQLYRSHFTSLERKYHIFIRELSSHIVLEQLIATMQNRLDLYLICSSVGIYGIMGGANVFTTGKRFLTSSLILKKVYKSSSEIQSLYTEI